MNAPVHIWNNPEAISVLQALVADHSAAQIAARLNEQFNTALTRSAILGKLKRLGIAGGVARRAEYDHATRQANRSAARPAVKRESKPITELPPSLNLTLAEINAGQCRYIAGEPVGGCYCGHPVQAGSSLCRAHHALCWRAPIERKRGIGR